MRNINPFSVHGRQSLPPLGRKQVFEQCAQWIQSSGSGCAYVEGTIGLGKSYFMEWTREHARYELYLDVLLAIRGTMTRNEFLRILSGRIVSLARERFSSQLSVREQAFFDQLTGKEYEYVVKILRDRFSKPAFRIFIAVDTQYGTPKEIESWIQETMQNASCETKILVAKSTFATVNIHAQTFTLGIPSVEEFEHWVQEVLRGTKIAIGPEALRSVYEECGGNPRMMIDALFVLYARLPEKESIISKGLLVNSRAAIQEELSVLFDNLYGTLAPKEREVLSVFAASPDPVRARQVEAQAHITQGVLSKIIERLVAKQSLLKKERGVYAILCPLYSSYIKSRSGSA